MAILFSPRMVGEGLGMRLAEKGWARERLFCDKLFQSLVVAGIKELKLLANLLMTSSI